MVLIPAHKPVVTRDIMHAVYLAWYLAHSKHSESTEGDNENYFLSYLFSSKDGAGRQGLYSIPGRSVWMTPRPDSEGQTPKAQRSTNAGPGSLNEVTASKSKQTAPVTHERALQITVMTWL